MIFLYLVFWWCGGECCEKHGPKNLPLVLNRTESWWLKAKAYDSHQTTRWHCHPGVCHEDTSVLNWSFPLRNQESQPLTEPPDPITARVKGLSSSFNLSRVHTHTDAFCLSHTLSKSSSPTHSHANAFSTDSCSFFCLSHFVNQASVAFCAWNRFPSTLTYLASF